METEARGLSFRFASGISTRLLLLAFCTLPLVQAQTTQSFTINTTAVAGRAGRIVFDYVTSNPEQGAEVFINNFAAPSATIGLPSSSGGLILGDLILGLNPAPQTQITTDYFGQGAAFTELVVNVSKFSNSITFQIQFPSVTTPAGSPPDQFSLFVLDSAGNPWFNTGDPLGANALVSYEPNGSTGTLKVFAPATAPTSSTISIVLPPNTNGLFLNRTSLNFGGTSNKATITSAQNVFLLVPAGVTWSATSDHAYVSVSPPSGTGSKLLSISIVPAQLPASGTITASITVTANTTNSPQNIAVSFAYVTTDNPFGSFDTPANNTTGISGAIAVTGWALDPIEISVVDIWREKVGTEPVSSNGLVFIGNAVKVPDARPDVQAQYPGTPYNYRAGWGYLLLTTGLPNTTGTTGTGNGTYKIHAIAHNTTGVSLDLGTRTITVDNAHAAKPFGTIDTPGQGDTISGTQFVNFGWALTQTGFNIPINGSTITVTVDGQNQGNPVYNQFRSDIANAFPGLANSNGAIGYFFIDTTKLANGVHTIGWVVYDNQGRGDGVGSRFFNVSNGGTSDVLDDEPGGPVDFSGEITLRRGFDPAATAEPATRTDTGWVQVDVDELDRIELNAGASSGYLIGDSEPVALPAGSSLKNGVFYWQPGPGFSGVYHVVLVQPGGTLVPVKVNIRPKGVPGAEQ